MTLRISLMPKRNSRNILETIPPPKITKQQRDGGGCCTVSQKSAFHLLVKQKSNRKSSTPSLPSKRLASQSLLTNDNDRRMMMTRKPHGNFGRANIFKHKNWCLVFLSFFSKKELTHSWVTVGYMGPFMSHSKKTSQK